MRSKSKSYTVQSIPRNDHSANPLLDSASHLSQQKSKIDDDHDGPDTTCGIGSWRPQWLQFFATPGFFMINMALVGVIQGMTGTLFFSSISTFEKRYSFDSTISGVILVADNFAELILNPIVGYIGVRFNRARLIAMGEVILSISCFLTATPYFLYGPATHLINDQSLVSNRTNFEMCSVADGAQYDCTDGQVTVWPAVFFLVLGSFARGLGYTCYFVIGFPYLDDNLSKKSSPIYIAIMQSIRLIGPGTGFMLSSFCLSFYENPFYDPGFGKNDPRWVGAWWMSFCVVGSLILLAALPMFAFPAEFKQSHVKTKQIQKKIKEGGGSKGAMIRFLKNPLVMLCLFGNIFRFIGHGGYIMFKSKYVESQYRQSSSSASLITRVMSFYPMAIGIVLGCVIISVLRPSPRKIYILVFLVESVTLFTVGSGFFLGCDPINIGNHDEFGRFSLQSTCNSHCEPQCSTRVYTPICGPDGRTTYFSPCYAGCTTYNPLNSTFEKCSCFDGIASKGYCKSDVTQCTTLYKYMTIVTIGGIISSSARTPNTLLQLRNVEEHDKGFAIGMASTLLDIFAFIPYPLLFGFIVNKACLIWEKRCGSTGSCFLYDHHKFRTYLHGAAVGFMALGSMFDFAVIFYAGRIKNFYEDNVDDHAVTEEVDHDSDDHIEMNMLPANENVEHDVRLTNA